ncbi:MAG: hypothetical protein IKO99_01100 [Bacteroidales bacterium]|nr:hypothetical protein [Bacteroidales bacterium]
MAAILLVVSCGPSAQEQQAMLEKAKNEVRDSITRIKNRVDSLHQIELIKKDSVRKSEERRQVIEDSLNNNANSQKWIYEFRGTNERIATLKSVDDSLTIKVLDRMHYNDIYFYCDKIKLNDGFFRKKNIIQVKFNKSRAIEYVVVANGIDCVKLKNMYSYVHDFKKDLQNSCDFEICFPTTDGWKNYQFSPDSVLDFNKAQ